MWSDLGSYEQPVLNQALEKDDADITHLLRRVINSESSDRAVMQLEGDAARRFIDILDSVCNLVLIRAFDTTLSNGARH